MVLRVDNVSRRFGPVVACDDVSLSVARGEVVALLGENGAGKSTLLSIVAGFVAPDQGAVTVAEAVLPPGDPAAAIRGGVGTAFQHFSLAPALRVGENLALARIAPDAARPLLPEHIPLSAPVGSLPVPERQQVEFLKARMLAREVLLLDEPTSLLGDADVDRVLGQIREVAATGVAVVFVTHRLREALAVADRVLVMRRGRIVERLARGATGWPHEAADDLLDAMFGDAWAHETDEPPARATGPGSGGAITLRGPVGGRLLDISLEPGRWLAVAGVAGNGQDALADVLTGASTTEAGVVSPAGAATTFTGPALRAWVAAQVAVVPGDRWREGGPVDMPVGETLVLRDLAAGRLSRGGVVSLRALRRRAEAMIRRWDIRPASPATRYGDLSGGNAQRVLLARALDPPPGVLVAIWPTHGLDHHSVAMVREHLRAAADAGAAVVTIEQELDEALRHADTVSVIARGRVSAPVSAATADRAALQRLMVQGWEA